MIAERSPLTFVPLGLMVLVAGGLAALNLYAAGVLMGISLVALLLTQRDALLPALLLTSVLNRLGLDAGGAQIRLDLVMVAMAAAVVLNRLAVRTLTPDQLNSPILLPLAAYAACNLLSTVIAAHEKVRGLKLDAQILAVLAAVVVLSVIVRDRRDLERAIQILWIVTVGEALIGLALVVLNLGGITGLGVQAGSFGLPMAYGTTYEANIFGSLLLGNFFLLLADYVGHRRSRRHGAGLLVILGGILASETRTAWLGLLIGLAICAALFLRHRDDGSRLLPVVAAIPILGLGAGILGAATPLAGRLLEVVDLHSSSASGRLVIFQAALQDWRAHPLIGLGTGSFNFGAGPGQPHPWLPNLFLLTLHDTGIVGAAALLWLIVAFYRAAFRNLNAGATAAPIAIGSVGGFTGLLIAFQTTSGFWFVYPWVVAAVGILAGRAASAPR